MEGAREAAARPAMATSRANMRMAEFIFSNLVDSIQKKVVPFSKQKSYRKSYYKSSAFIMLEKYNETWVLTSCHGDIKMPLVITCTPLSAHSAGLGRMVK